VTRYIAEAKSDAIALVRATALRMKVRYHLRNDADWNKLPDETIAELARILGITPDA